MPGSGPKTGHRHSGDAHEPTQGASGTDTKDANKDSDPVVVRRGASTPGSGPKTSHRHSGDANEQTQEASGSNTKDANKHSDPVVAVPTSVTPVSDPAPISDVPSVFDWVLPSDPAPASDPAPTSDSAETFDSAPASAVAAPVSDPGPASDPPTASDPPPTSGPAAASDPAPPSAVAASVSDPAPPSAVAAPVSDVVAPVSDVIAPVPVVIAPAPDVVAWVQNTLTSVFGAIASLTQLQSDLYAFLMGLTGGVPVENGSREIHGSEWSAAADASVVSQLRLALLRAGVSGVQRAGKVEVATLRGIGASIFSAMSEVARASALPGTLLPAPNGAISMGLRSFVPHSFSDLPRAASLWALAAVALPGLGGLVILTLAGVRIGYRQAKAASIVRTTGIARFARAGPLGVVRSGSLVAIGPRGLRVVRSRASSAGSLLEVA